LIIENLTFKLGKQKILDKVNFEIGKGLYQIKGKSGSGKSTLLYLIKGVIPSKIKHHYQVSMMNQETYLIENKTIYENLLLMSKNIEQIEKYLNLFMLDKTKMISQLSLGQKQQVSFIQTILKEADIYLFDEPTSNLDKASEKKVFNIMETLSKEFCVIFCSHRNCKLGKLINNEGKKIKQTKTKTKEIIKHKKGKLKVIIPPCLIQKIFLYIFFSLIIFFVKDFKMDYQNNIKYQFNDYKIENKILFTSKYKILYNVQLKGINHTYEGLIINDVASKTYQLNKNDLIYDEENQYNVIDIIKDEYMIPTIYFSSLGKEVESNSLDGLFFQIDKSINYLKIIMIVSLFICFLFMIIILAEKNMRNYLLIDLLFDSKHLKITIFLEVLLTSFFLFKFYLVIMNILSGLIIYSYIKKREISLLRNIG